MGQRVQIMGVCSVLCQNNIWLKEFNDFLHGCTIDFKERLIFRKGIYREIKRSAISLAAAAFIDVASSGEQVAAGFMDGDRTDIRIIIKAPLNTVSMMGVCINIQNTGVVFAFQVIDGY